MEGDTRHQLRPQSWIAGEVRAWRRSSCLLHQLRTTTEHVRQLHDDALWCSVLRYPNGAAAWAAEDRECSSAEAVGVEAAHQSSPETVEFLP